MRARIKARAEREKERSVRIFTCKDVLKKAFFAQFCLFGHFFGSVVRYNEALEYVRNFLETFGCNSDDGFDDGFSGDGSSGREGDCAAAVDSTAEGDTESGSVGSVDVVESCSGHHEDAGAILTSLSPASWSSSKSRPGRARAATKLGAV